ncbi:VOC family protein [bacterium]|nr:VOC family protein [bacterium]
MSRFGFVEIPAKDISASMAFYAGLFGWKFNALPTGRYAYFHTAGEIHGALSADDAPGQGVIVYLEVADIEATLEEIKYSGGSIVTKKTMITKEEGYYARFADPSGNVLGLWSKT